jgi:hypothetical protein
MSRTRVITKAEAARILRGEQRTTPRYCQHCGRIYLTTPEGMWCRPACKQAAYRARLKAAAAQSA